MGRNGLGWREYDDDDVTATYCHLSSHLELCRLLHHCRSLCVLRTFIAFVAGSFEGTQTPGTTATRRRVARSLGSTVQRARRRPAIE